MVCSCKPSRIDLCYDLQISIDILFAFFYVTAECTAADAFKHAGENIVFGSGSPFKNVDLGTFPTC